MTSYLDPISVQIVGDNLNMSMNKDLRGSLVLTVTQDGTPVDLSGLPGQLILTTKPCNGYTAASITLFQTGSNMTFASDGTITLIVNDTTVGLAGDGVYDYRLMVGSGSEIQQYLSGIFEINEV